MVMLTLCSQTDFPGYKLWVKKRCDWVQEDRLAIKVAELAINPLSNAA